MATMKAVQLTKASPDSPPTISLETLPKPTLSPGHLLIKVHASAIHPSDILNSKGSFGLTKFPRVPGRDFAGIIAEGPSNRIGEEVYGTSGFTQAFSVDGAHAEYILVSENAVAPKPKSLSFVQAAGVGVPFTTASLILRRANAASGEVVLVLGASGAVGSAVAQVAKEKGLRVLSGVRNDAGDVNTASDPKLEALDALTDGKGVDIVVDTVGQPSLSQAAVAKLRTGGRLVFIAAPRSGATELGIEMTDFYRKEKSLVGVNSLLYSVEENAEILKGLTEKFEKGLLKATGAWETVKLENGVHAYEKANQKGAKVMIVVD